jgi:hypothetical protein
MNSVSVEHEDATIDTSQRAQVEAALDALRLEQLYWDEIRRVTSASCASREARFALSVFGLSSCASALWSAADEPSWADWSLAGRAGQLPGEPTASRPRVEVEGFAPLLRGPFWQFEQSFHDLVGRRFLARVAREAR